MDCQPLPGLEGCISFGGAYRNSGCGQWTRCQAIESRSRPQIAQSRPQHADRAECKERAQPMEGLAGRTRFQGDPAKPETKKRPGKTDRDHSRRREKPFVRTLPSRGSCSRQHIHAHAHRHPDDNERNRSKCERPGCAENHHQPEEAANQAIQSQNPGAGSARSRDAPRDRTNPCRQREHAQLFHYASVRQEDTQTPRAVRAQHEQDNKGEHRIEKAGQGQQRPTLDRVLLHSAPPDGGTAQLAGDRGWIIAPDRMTRRRPVAALRRLPVSCRLRLGARIG